MGRARASQRFAMPTLIRLFVALVIIAILAGIAMFALANWVEPARHEIVIPIPPERLGL